jgi:Flp pilus assembly protein TadB
MRKPPITIKCECGETKSVAYGQRWVCDTCHRAWNTQQIPADEYEGLLRRVRRHKLEAVGMAAIAAAVMIPLIVVVSSGFIFLIPTVMVAWLFLVLPVWRRRYRQTAREAPRWELHPE